MPEEVTAKLGIELGADGAIRDAAVLKQNLNQLVTAEDAVIAASKAITEAFKAQSEQARADAAAARAQEAARKEAANATKAAAAAQINAAKESASAQAKAAADEARAFTSAKKAEENAAKQAARAIADSAKQAAQAEKEAASAMQAEARAAKEAQSALVAKARAEEQSAKAAAAAADAEKRATQATEQRTRASALQHAEALKMNASFDKQSQSANSLVGTYGQLTAAAIGYKALQYAREAVQLADAYTNIESRLSLVTSGTENLAHVSDALFRVSQDTRSGLESNVALYTSLARSTKTLGLNQEDLVGITKTVGQAFLVSGASASETSAAVRQLGQALASGVLRGDEFNSIAENAPRLQQAVADSLHVTIGELRAMAAEGKITGAVVTKALQDASKSINEEAGKIAPTFGGASTQAGNALLLLVGKINDATGATKGLSSEIKGFADYAESIARDEEFLNKVHNISLGFGLVKTVLADTGKGLGSIAELFAGGFAGAAAIGTGKLSAFETIARSLNKTMQELRGTYDGTAKLFEKPIGKSVFGASDFGSNPKPLAPPVTPKATKEEIEAQKKLQEQYEKTSSAAQRELDKQTELAAAYGKGTRAIEDINDAYELKNKLAAIDDKLSSTQKARLTELIVNTHSQEQAIKEQARAEDDKHKQGLTIFTTELNWANLRAANQAKQSAAIKETAADFERYGKGAVAASRAVTAELNDNAEAFAKQRERVEELTKAIKSDLIDAVEDFAKSGTHSFQSFFDSVGRLAGGLSAKIASALKEMNEEIEKGKASAETIASAANLKTAGKYLGYAQAGVGGYQAGKNAGAQSGDAFSGGVSGAASGAATGFAVGGVPGAFVGALAGVVGGIKAGTQAAKENKAALDAMRASYQLTKKSMQDLVDGASPLTMQINDVTAQFVSLRQQMGARDTNKGRGGDIARMEYDKELARVNELEVKRIAQLTAEAAVLDKRANQDLGIRLLAAQGQDKAADAAAFAYSQERELEDARKAGASATNLALLAVVQVAEAEKRLADQRKADAAEAQRVSRSVFDITTGANSFKDPRGATEAAFLENQKRRFDDAATSAESLAIGLYNAAEAADFYAQRALKDATDFANSTARILANRGDTRAAEDVSRKSAQATEYDSAFRGGASGDNLALLLKAQFSDDSRVQMERAIEDGTKAINESRNAQLKAVDEQIKDTQKIAAETDKHFEKQIKDTHEAAESAAKQFDEQIDAVREGAKAQLAVLDNQAEYQQASQKYWQEQTSLLSQQVELSKRVVDNLASVADGLKLGELSTLSPTQKLAEARSQFDALAEKARGGDKDAALGVGGALQELLSQSRNVNASGVGYAADFDRGQGILSALKSQFGSQLGGEQSALSKAENNALLAEQTLKGIEEQKDAINTATDKQVDALTALKEQSAADFASQIETLGLFKDAAAQGFADEIDRLGLVKDGINAFADAAITKLTDFETAANRDRIDRYTVAQPVRFEAPTTPSIGESAIITQLTAQNAVLVKQNELLQALVTSNANMASASGPQTTRVVEATDTSRTQIVNEIRELRTALVEGV